MNDETVNDAESALATCRAVFKSLSDRELAVEYSRVLHRPPAEGADRTQMIEEMLLGIPTGSV